MLSPNVFFNYVFLKTMFLVNNVSRFLTMHVYVDVTILQKKQDGDKIALDS